MVLANMHSGMVISTVSSQHEGPEFNSAIRPVSFCVEK